MTKEINHDPDKNHRKVHPTEGQRVSGCGGWIYMQDGSRFRRTTLPSVATGQTEVQDDVLEEIAEDSTAVHER